MTFFVASPIAFIRAVSPIEAHFVVFCATTLGTLTVLWVLSYLLFRPLPRHSVFAPLENISVRTFDVFLTLASAFGAYALSVALKARFMIGRPELLNFDFHPLISLPDYGFPSGHAAFFSALAVALFLMHRRAGIFAGLLALIIGTARVFAGVHTPLDIAGGYLLGTLVSLAFYFFATRVGGIKK